MSENNDFTIKAIIITVILVVGAAILIPNFMRRRSEGNGFPCQQSLKNISTALEMYSADNKGYYPTAISLLKGNYLKEIPTCEKTGSSLGYESSYTMSVKPHAYTFYCMGHNHKDKGVPPNYPQYNSNSGLIPR